MRITIVQGAFLPVPPLLGGGVEKLWFGLGKEFARLGHQVTHVSRRYDSLPDSEIIEGVQHLRIRGFDAPASKVLYRICDLLYALGAFRALPAADILVTNCIWLPVLIRNAKKGALYVHVARYPKGQMRLYAHAARLQTVSETVAVVIRKELPTLADKVHVIPPFLINSPPAINFKETRNNRKKTFLYVGRVHPEKGLHLLIPAFRGACQALHGEWKLEIVGPTKANMGGGGEKYLAELKNLCGGAPDILWHGFVSADELNALYKSSSLFVYPSLAEHGESFGSAPLEAMSLGCPALVSNLQCFTEFIEKDVNGFVFDHKKPHPVDELAAQMNLAISDQGRLNEVAARAYATTHSYQLEEIARRYIEDFENVICEQMRSGRRAA